MYAVNAIYDGVSMTEQAKKRPRSEIIGCLKGKVWMAEDFNDPIEELKEYMENYT